MITALGPKATSYAERIGDLDAIIADPDRVGDAYREAVRRRERGETFYGLLLIDDQRINFGYKQGEAILAQLADPAVRRLAAGQLADGSLALNGGRVDALWGLDSGYELVWIEFLWLCDAMLVRSFAEYARIEDVFARCPIRRTLRPVERVLAAANVPVVERVRPDRPGVVLWAPDRPALEFALHLHGLADFEGDVTCVSAGGAHPSRTTATFLDACAPGVAAALCRASAIVCLDPSDPSAAVAFARGGHPVIAPFSSGAHEFASAVVTWDALDAHVLPAAVATAMNRPVRVCADVSPPPRAPQGATRPPFVSANELPLVSIVTPTYNRRDDLRRMLACLAAQTYPNIESLVVNDGGAPVDDIVAEFPFARVIDQPANAGALMAVEVGRRHIRGEYVGLLPDDDWLYPDHVERLMDAIFRTGALVAHGAGLLRYVERAESGESLTKGFNATTFCQSMIGSDALVSATIGGHQMIVHRSVYDTVGGYRLDSEISDNEMHIRIAARYFYAFVDHVTAEFRDHTAGAGRRCDFPAALRHIYTEVHPAKGRPYLDRMRAATIANVERRQPGKPPFPPSLLVHR